MGKINSSWCRAEIARIEARAARKGGEMTAYTRARLNYFKAQLEPAPPAKRIQERAIGAQIRGHSQTCHDHFHADCTGCNCVCHTKERTKAKKRWPLRWSGTIGEWVIDGATYDDFAESDMIVKDAWIPVGRRVPRQIMADGELVDPIVLVYSARRPHQHSGRYVTTLKQWRYCDSNTNFSHEITHWRPFPDPPQETV